MYILAYKTIVAGLSFAFMYNVSAHVCRGQDSLRVLIVVIRPLSPQPS